MKLIFVRIPQLARVFSNQHLSHFFRLLFALYFFIFSRKLKLIKHDFPLSVTYNGAVIKLFLRYPMDLAVLDEVFLAEEYAWSPSVDPECIIDLGGHFGDTALYYRSRYPKAKIIVIEPSAENFKRILKHVSHDSGIIPIQAAVGAEDGCIDLHLGPSSLGYSVLDRGNTSTIEKVPMQSLDSIMAQANCEKIDILKFDIEGAEFGLFPSLSEKVGAIIGELHFDLNDSYSLRDMESILEEYNPRFECAREDDRFIVTGER